MVNGRDLAWWRPSEVHMTAPRLAVLAASALLLACSSSSTPAPAFSTADLAGHWHFAMVADGTAVAAGNAIGWRRGEATIDAAGVVTVTSTLDSAGGTTPPVTAPVFSVDANGVVTASLAGTTDFNGQLSRGKDLMIVTASETGPAVMLRVWQKIPAGTTFAAADLPGSWSYHEVFSGSTDGWEHGVASVNALGGLALSSRVDAAGAQPDVPQLGSLAIDAGGWVTASFNPSWLAMMSPDKSRLVGTQTTDLVNHVYGLNVIVRAEHLFASGDLGGDYAFRLLDSSPTGGTWGRGHVSVAASGATHVTDQLDSTGDTSIPPPFTFALTSGGVVTSPDLVGAAFHGQLSADRALLAATQRFGLAEGGLILAVRR
jgi:hypothetical protein